MSLIAGNLGFVQRLLDQHKLVWGVCAGAAAYVYGNRRPIQDVDILVAPGRLSTIVQLLQNAQKAVQFDGQRILWRGIKLFDDLTIRRAGSVYSFSLDTLMSDRLRRMSLLGAPVAVLAPEDIVIHKLILGRDEKQGKHDYADAAAICRSQQLDLGYLEQRLQRSNARALVEAQLRELGVLHEARN
jgi:hypothetical protein